MDFSVLNLFLAGATAVLTGMLGWACAIDWRSFRLPDALVLPLVPMGLGVSAVLQGGWPLDAALGAAAGFAVFYLLGEIYFRARGVEGLGIGDAKLLAAAGAWLGIAALPIVVLLSALPALAIAFVTGRMQGRIAFGPYLGAAFLCVWIWDIYLKR